MADAVTLGLIAGSFGSIFVILGGLAAASSKDSVTGDYSYKYFTFGNGLFWWLVILTALVVGMLIYVKMLSDYFLSLPKQSATVS
jgi:uncharacterized membrane protein